MGMVNEPVLSVYFVNRVNIENGTFLQNKTENQETRFD